MKRKALYIFALACALVLLLTLPISASDDMKKIEAGTYCWNDVLTQPPYDDGRQTVSANFTVSTVIDSATAQAIKNQAEAGGIQADFVVQDYSFVCAYSALRVFVNNGEGDKYFILSYENPNVSVAPYDPVVEQLAPALLFGGLEAYHSQYEWGHPWYQTITIPYDQYVSCEFGVWFAENTVRQGSSVPSDPSVPSAPSEGCTSFNEYTYSCDCGVGYGSNWNGPEIMWRDDTFIAYQDSCKDCGTDITYVVWSDHDYVIEVISATCTTPGRIEFTCSNCGDFYVSSETAALGHDFSVPTVYPATCTAAGYTLYTCSRAGCGQVWVDPDSYVAGNHDMKAIKTVHATCTEPGYIDKACSECGKKERTVLNALDHFWIQKSVAPTCTKKGFTKNVCARCEIYELVPESETAAVGHNYFRTIIDGKEYDVCQNCADRVLIGDYVLGDGNEEDPDCVHTFTTFVIDPTCEGRGSTWYECSKCGFAFETDFVDKIPHQYQVVGRKEPTCTVSGYLISECETCGKAAPSDDTFLPPLGHSWKTVSSVLGDDDMITTKSECTRCHVTKTETFPTAAGQAQNWLLTVIRGLFSGFIDMYETVANGIEIGGVTAGEVITGSLIIACFLFLLFLLLKVLG